MEGKITSKITGGGVSISSTITRSDDDYSPMTLTKEIAAAKAGTLTTRTDNDTGVATLSTGHGIVTSDAVDVYWATGIRRGMTATVATNAVTIDGGSGDNLPAQDTAVKICKQVELTAAFNGAKVKMAAFQSDRRAYFDTLESAVSVAGAELIANEAWSWADDTAIDNPFGSSDIDTIVLSNGDSAGVATIKVLVLLDAAA
jgi:hypothetical protein